MWTYLLALVVLLACASLTWYVWSPYRVRRVLRIARDKSLPLDRRLRATRWLILRGWGPDDDRGIS